MTENAHVVGLKMSETTGAPQIAVNVGDGRYDFVWKGLRLSFVSIGALRPRSTA